MGPGSAPSTPPVTGLDPGPLSLLLSNMYAKSFRLTGTDWPGTPGVKSL
jgi:hypothetical protein